MVGILIILYGTLREIEPEMIGSCVLMLGVCIFKLEKIHRYCHWENFSSERLLCAGVGNVSRIKLLSTLFRLEEKFKS